MRLNYIIRTFVIILLVVANLGCDQVSKNIARENISYNERISVLDDYITLTKVENSGAFLSFGNAFPAYLKTALLEILPLIVLLIALIYVLTNQKLSKLAVVGFCFIVGGGVGNIYDRILYGSVTDFVHMDFVLFQTGIFNMADVSIMMGMFMILFSNYFMPKKVVNSAIDQ